MGVATEIIMSEIEHLSGSEDSSDIGSGSSGSDSSSGSESESSSDGENVPMTRSSKRTKLKKELTDNTKASEMFTKMLEKNNKNINNTNKQTLGSITPGLGGNLPISTKNILIRSAKTGLENLQLVFKKSKTEIGNRIKNIPDVSGRFVQKIELGNIFALLLRILLIPMI